MLRDTAQYTEGTVVDESSEINEESPAPTTFFVFGGSINQPLIQSAVVTGTIVYDGLPTVLASPEENGAAQHPKGDEEDSQQTRAYTLESTTVVTASEVETGIPTLEDDYNNPQYSTFVKVYVKYSCIITILHLVMAILCSIFALPYVSLSKPQAGLRLRDDPIADRADGFIAAALQMLDKQKQLSADTPPTLVGELPFLRNRATLSQERIGDAEWIILIWYTDPPSNIFTEENIEYMKWFEETLFNLPTYQQQLCKLNYDGTCVKFNSPLDYLLSPAAQKLPLTERVKRLDPYFLSADFDQKNSTSSITRTGVPIGAPIPPFTGFDGSAEQKDKYYALMQQEVIPFIVQKAFKDGRNPKLTYDHPGTVERQSMDILLQDLVYSFLVLALVFCCLVWHMKSLFLAIGGLLQIIVSFPMTLFCYRMLLDIRLFGGLHAIAIFLILGIGVDDCFVIYDAFDQATREHPHRSQVFRMDIAYRTSRYAMFFTSLNQCIGFFSLVSCGIPILEYFGVFSTLLVMINYTMVMTLFAGMLLIWDKRLRRKPGDRPGLLRRLRSRVTDRCKPRGKFAKKLVSPMSTSSSVLPFSGVVRRRSSLGSIQRNPHSTTVEKMFLFVAENFTTTRWGKPLIIFGSLTIIGVFTMFAAELKPSDSIDSFWPKGHPFRVYEELSSNGFYGQVEDTATIRFVNGMEAPFRINYDYTNDADFGTPIYDENFDPTNIHVQQFMTDQCDQIRAELSKNKLLYSKNGESTCPMNDFRDWAIAKGQDFPMSNPVEFAVGFMEYMYQPYKQGNGTTATQIVKIYNDYLYMTRIMFNQFPTTRSQRADDIDSRTELYNEWSQFARNKTIPGLGDYGSTAPIDGFYEVWMETQLILLYSAYTSVAYSIAMAFPVLLIATHGDVYSSAVGTFTLAASGSSTMGVMYLAGWSLGAVEAVSCTIMSGIAIDYSIHMCIAFAETFFEGLPLTRNDRAIEASRRLGVSLVYGGMTALISGCILLMCTLTILFRFGQFMIMVVSFSLVFSLIFQMAVLSLPIPSRPLMFKKGEHVHKHSSTPHASMTLSVNWYFAIYALLLVGANAAIVGVGISYQKRMDAENASKNGRRLLEEDSLPRFDHASSVLDELPMGKWSEIVVDPNSLDYQTGCAAPGASYSFFVYRGDESTGSSPVYLEFEGRASSSCYDAESCKSNLPVMMGGFARSIDRTRFELINSEKDSFPFLMKQQPKLEVYFPYCSADSFLGNTTANYYSGAKGVHETQHLGQNNARAGMEWLFRQLRSRTTIAESNFILQGCGAGGVGALATAGWAVPKLRDEFSVQNISLIVDSANLVLKDGSVRDLAERYWNAPKEAVESLDLYRTNATMQGRMLVASSTFDWFQTRASGLARESREFRRLVEDSDDVYPYLLRLNGDRHCVVLNPIKDRLETDPRVQEVVKYFSGDSSSKIRSTEDLASSRFLYHKCEGKQCELNADLRHLEMKTAVKE